jgi:hypothetical protein
MIEHESDFKNLSIVDCRAVSTDSAGEATQRNHPKTINANERNAAPLK